MRWLNGLHLIGPGFVIAATGLGAGDLIAATVSGAKLGTTILWAVVIGALIKLVLNEGLARWQLATQTTLLEGWLSHLPRWVNYYFLAYLFLWSFLVGAALMAACGLAANAIAPQLSINSWAVIHSLLALTLVIFGRYSFFELAMKILIALMFITVITAVGMMDFSGLSILKPLLIPSVPESNRMLVLGVIGGVGGSVTLLCYGYWIKEKGWNSLEHLKLARMDLVVAYSLTAIFGICIMLLAAKAQPETLQGTQIILALADELGNELGTTFRWIFLAGFWGAVFSSMLGVWQGVPYLFSDFMTSKKKHSDKQKETHFYRTFLLFIAIPPFGLLLFGKPVWLVLIYSVTGALFMPFLALTLLFLNNKYIPSNSKNTLVSNGLMLLAIALFCILGLEKMMS